jgi:hypothetical protein
MLHHTRLLLHRFGDLRAHTADSIYDAAQLEEMEIAELIIGRDPDVKIDAIRRSVTRTELLTANIEEIYRRWEESGRSRNDALKRRIIRQRYFEKIEIPDIAKRERKSKALVLSLLGQAIGELSSRFFGKDGFLQGDGQRRTQIG